MKRRIPAELHVRAHPALSPDQLPLQASAHPSAAVCPAVPGSGVPLQRRFAHRPAGACAPDPFQPPRADASQHRPNVAVARKHIYAHRQIVRAPVASIP